MLVIGICDGDTAVRALLSSYICRYREETGLNVQVLSYDTGEKLLHHYPLEMDLVFLEIPFTCMNGIEIARRIRVVDANVGIVFLTTVLNHVLEAYDVHANNYLIKPLRYQRFLQEVEEARLRHGLNRFFLETNASGVYKIYIRSIRWIETVARNTRIHTETDSILSRRTMKEHEQTFFESHFIRCHAGYLVNLLFMDRLAGSELVLLTGESIPVSRQRRVAVLERIHTLYDRQEEP